MAFQKTCDNEYLDKLPEFVMTYYPDVLDRFFAAHPEMAQRFPNGPAPPVPARLPKPVSRATPIPSNSAYETDTADSLFGDTSSGSTVNNDLKSHSDILSRREKHRFPLSIPSTIIADPDSHESSSALAAHASHKTSKAIPPESRSEFPPPPVFIHDKVAWMSIVSKMSQRQVTFSHARLTPKGIKVIVPTEADHGTLTALLRENRHRFTTYPMNDERLLRVVIRGLPKEFTVDDICSDLKEHSLPVHYVRRMINPKNNSAYDMVQVVLDGSPEGKAIFEIKSICNLTGISVEPALRTSHYRNERRKQYVHFCCTAPTREANPETSETDTRRSSAFYGDKSGSLTTENKDPTVPTGLEATTLSKSVVETEVSLVPTSGEGVPESSELIDANFARIMDLTCSIDMSEVKVLAQKIRENSRSASGLLMATMEHAQLLHDMKELELITSQIPKD